MKYIQDITNTSARLLHCTHTPWSLSRAAYSCGQRTSIVAASTHSDSDAAQLMEACTRHEPVSPTALAPAPARRSSRRVKVCAAAASFVSTTETCPSCPSPLFCPAERGAAVPGSQIDAGASERVQLVARTHAWRQADGLDATHGVYVHHKHALHTHTCSPARLKSMRWCSVSRFQRSAAAPSADEDRCNCRLL